MTGRANLWRRQDVTLRAGSGACTYLRVDDTHNWLLPAPAMEIRLHSRALERWALDLTASLRVRRPEEEIGGLLLGAPGILRAPAFLALKPTLPPRFTKLLELPSVERHSSRGLRVLRLLPANGPFSAGIEWIPRGGLHAQSRMSRLSASTSRTGAKSSF